MLFLKHCSIFIVLVLICFCYGTASKVKFSVKPTNVTICPHPVHPMDKDTPLAVRSFIRVISKEKSLIDVNYNISRPFGPLSVSIRVYQVLKDDKMKPIFNTDAATCKNPITFQAIRIMKGPIDKNCMLDKGSFWIRDLDLNIFGWVMSKGAISSGQYVYEVEYINANNCIYCNKLICELSFKK